MEVTFREFYDHECAQLLVILDVVVDEAICRQLEQFLVYTLNKEIFPSVGMSLECVGCSVRPSESGVGVKIVVRPLPQDLVTTLAKRIEKAFPSCVRIEAGLDYVGPKLGRGHYVQIPNRTILLEDGSKCDVSSFVIAKYPVSVGEFREFASDAGYITTAEQRHDEYSYLANPGIDMLSPGQRDNVPANFVSAIDAMAYCAWSGHRLPTEAEWVAASLLDERVYDESMAEVTVRTRMLELRPEALGMLGGEITAPKPASSKTIVRDGPAYFWTYQGRANPGRNRRMAPLTYYEFLAFRVCKDCPVQEL